MITQKGKFIFALGYLPYVDGSETRIHQELIVKEIIKETGEVFNTVMVPNSMFYLTKQDDLDIVKKQLTSFVDEVWAIVVREEEELKKKREEKYE